MQAAVEACGIKVTTVAAHEDEKSTIQPAATIVGAGVEDAVAVIGYIDQGGKGIIQASLDSLGVLDVFILSDGMIGDSNRANFGKALNKSFFNRPTGKKEFLPM